jgi:phage protein D/phage baseplate assembly protein gpV
MSAIATLPRIDVQLDGQSLSESAAATLEEVRVQRRLSQPSLCELTFYSGRDSLVAVQDISAGSTLRLIVPSTGMSLFQGEVTAVEYAYGAAHGQTVRVRCYDQLHRLRKRQPVRVHVQVTPEELARELVADLGLSVEASESGPLLQRIIQYRQSDLDLLVETARRFGLYLVLQEDVLHLTTLEGTGESIQLALGKTLLEARVEVNGDPACRSVLAKGWDLSRVEAHEARVNSAHVGRSVDAEAPPEKFGVDGERTLADELLQDDRHAEAIAQAELDLRIQREVTLWGVAEGNPDLVPGAGVDVSGLAGHISGKYVLTSVTHQINRQTGFVSEITTAPPNFENRPKAASAGWGTVTRVDDPDQLGRVRVSLPAIGNVETEWLGVVAAGAGSGKGLVVMPAVGDHVLMLFLGGDASQGVVLGGLFGVHGPGDYGVDGNSIQRFTLSTPGGQKIRLDDSGESIRIENKGGSFLELSPQKARLHSAVDLEIEAPGCGVVIKGKTIDFREA